MAYFAPYIDGSGLHIPTYIDIIEKMKNDTKSIYGQDIYLENDSMDYQMLSSIAAYLNDAMQSLQLAYNSRGPQTAVGSALDGVIKINGLKREPSTLTAKYSTCPVVLSGTAGTVIINGIVQDVSGYNWDLPDTVTLDGTGSAMITATCETAGSIIANIGDINTIATPTYGWNAVTNSVAATVGVDVETDGAVRARQAFSTSLPSQTPLDGLVAAIAALDGVTRYQVYENDTNTVDSNGLPPHSITAVVEGGVNTNIANTIMLKKTPGAYTNGTTSVSLVSGKGIPTVIRFYRPSYVDIDVVVNVKQLSGYTTAITTKILNNLVAYLNSLAINADLSISALWAVVLQAMPSLTTPLFSVTGVTAAKHGQAQGTTDIVTAFNEVVRGNAAYITINLS